MDKRQQLSVLFSWYLWKICRAMLDLFAAEAPCGLFEWQPLSPENKWNLVGLHRGPLNRPIVAL